MPETKIFTPEQKAQLKTIADHNGLIEELKNLAAVCDESAAPIAAGADVCECTEDGIKSLDKPYDPTLNAVADVFVALHEIKILLQENPDLMEKVQKAASFKINERLQEIQKT